MVGIFDSGSGGLTILKALLKHFPNHDFTYIADYKNLPYGTKSLSELTAITKKLLDYFINCDVIIIACNTLSGLITKGYIDTSAYPPIINMISCLSTEFLEKKHPDDRLGILATKFTVELGEYERLIGTQHPVSHIQSIAATDLVPALESLDPNIDHILSKYLKQFSQNITHIILGCTHYNLLWDRVQKRMPDIIIVNPYLNIINRLRSLNISNVSSQVKFLRTNTLIPSSLLANRMMGYQIPWHNITL
ncbi:MAG: glutamate racemase [Brevinema sp.]